MESSELSEKFQFFKLKLLMGFGDQFLNGILQQVFFFFFVAVSGCTS